MKLLFCGALTNHQLHIFSISEDMNVCVVLMMVFSHSKGSIDWKWGRFGIRPSTIIIPSERYACNLLLPVDHRCQQMQAHRLNIHEIELWFFDSNFV